MKVQSTAAAVQMTRPSRRPGLASYLNPLSFATHLWARRDMIAQFTRREIEGRYRSSLLGLAWSFINPLVLLLVYTFVFGVVFRQRWSGITGQPAEDGTGLAQFGLVLFAGLIVFGIFSESINRAPGLIVSTPNYVKRVVFPLEILPVSSLGSALFHAIVSLSVLLALHLALGGRPLLSWLLIPIVVLPVVALTLGLSWLLASLGVFIRDLTYSVTLAVQVLFFITPIFYPASAIPASWRAVVHYNPLAPAIEAMRTVVFTGPAVEWEGLAVSGALGLAVMLLGYAWFMRTRRAFGDVI